MAMTTETRERITDADRISRLEGAQEHMATRADLIALDARLSEKIVESEIRSTERIAEKIAASEIRLTEKIAERIAESEARTTAMIAAKIAESEIRLTEKMAAMIAESDIRLTEKMAAMFAASDARTAEKIAAAETRMIRWMVGGAIILFFALASLIIAALAILYCMLR